MTCMKKSNGPRDGEEVQSGVISEKGVGMSGTGYVQMISEFLACANEWYLHSNPVKYASLLAHLT